MADTEKKERKEEDNTDWGSWLVWLGFSGFLILGFLLAIVLGAVFGKK